MDSKLQIISGAYRGRKLRLPPNARPTQNRARIALFNMLDSGILNTAGKFRVWDAFAGSGAFGLECLSRYGGADVVFTDTAPDSIKTVRANLAALGVDARASVSQRDAIGTIGTHAATADLIFVDPPYADSDLGAAFVRRAAGNVRPGTILIWEQDSPRAMAPDENAWEILRDKKYGRARFLILQRRAQ